jgi:hypothetical protein
MNTGNSLKSNPENRKRRQPRGELGEDRAMQLIRIFEERIVMVWFGSN